MKNVRKFVGMLLALVMIFSMTAGAFAAEDVTITAPAGSTRTYDVYQIFTGNLSGNVLSNVKWGENGTGKAGEAVAKEALDALTAVNSLSDTAKLTEIKKYVDLESSAIGTVDAARSLDVAPGYYLIKDKGPVNDTEAYSLYIVQVVGPTTISPKTGTTTSQKKVKDTNDSVADSTTDWQDSADYDIGDAVPFQLKATIAQDYNNYKIYKLTFHDREGAGLTFNRDSVKVYVDNNEITSGFEVVESPSDDDTFEVRFADLKQIASVQAGSVIRVEYTSTLNEKAEIGAEGNKNTMHITYSNNPNDEQGGENGKTPEDTVIVFTYKTVVNKVTENPDYDKNKDSDNDGIDDDDHEKYIPLKGAGFTLYKKNSSGKYAVVGDELKDTDMTTFEWKGLDDGDYKLVETTTPAGYNTIADIEFTISAEHDVTSDNLALNSLSGGDIFTGTAKNGTLEADVINNTGSTLPSTGGMGTTIFYVLGGILVVGAVVLLVARKRMNDEK